MDKGLVIDGTLYRDTLREASFLLTNIKRKKMLVTNTTFCCNDTGEEKSFVTLTPGPNVLKRFAVIIYEYSQQARVFVNVKLFQPSLMFVDKAMSLS